MNAETEIYITGIGIVSSLGVGTEKNWQSMLRGRSGIGPVTSVNVPDCPTQIAGELPEEFGPYFASLFPGRIRRHTATFTQLGLACAHMALEDSGIDMDSEDRTAIGVCIGTGAGGLSYFERMYDEMEGKDVETMSVVKFMPNAVAGMISLQYGIEGHSMVVSNACSSGAYAIGTAVDLIRLGKSDVVLAGGPEAAICRSSLFSFSRLLTLSTRNDEPEKASRPFDRLRDGFVLGDGAAVLILESAHHCRKRGAKPYARILGYATSSEAHHIVHPHDDGEKMAITMNRALQESAVSPDKVDYISAHGTATELNDKYETSAFKQVFGPRAHEIPISSQKSMIGHTIGAAGAIELAVTALTVSRDAITPTINLENPDEECDLDYTPNEAREKQVNVALSNSFGFGGANSTIVLGKV
jgi:3-oxoacyl-[acyl-carrier-protein] synthase II